MEENTEAKRNTPAQAFSEMRGDLEISVVPRGQGFVAVVKDPLAHRFYEMNPADVEIARHLSSTADVSAQIRLLRENCPAETHGLEDKFLLRRAARISAELRAMGLARQNINSTRAARQNQDLGRMLLKAGSAVSRVLFLRFRLFDPTPILDATAGFAAPFFSRWFLWCILTFFAVSFTAFVSHGGLSKFDSGWFSSPLSLLALYVGIAILKFIHEAGHAFAVRRFGGQSHEVGITLVAGLPLFHVEASDSYMFPQKSSRLVVAAAGILIELFACSLLILVWLVLADGFLHQLFTSLIIIASISTLLFNGNPLMRYDGYYILSDAIDMPDLRQRARSFAAEGISHLLSGTKSSIPVPRREAWILGLYGTASPLYLLVVFFGIWKFLSGALAPHGLKWAGDLLMLSWAVTGILAPGFSTVKKIAVRVKTAPLRSRKRMGVFAAILASIAVLLFVPFSRKIVHSGSLQPSAEAAVRAPEAGRIASVLVSEGTRVSKGQPIAILENTVIEREVESAESMREQAATTWRTAMAAAKTSDVGVLKSELSAAESRLAEAKRRHAALTLRAPCDGVVATRRLDSFQETHLAPGGTLCVIQPAQLSEFLITLDEKQARLVRSGAQARVRFRSRTGETFPGTVAAQPLRLAPPAPGEPSAPPGADTHFATIQLTNTEAPLKIGMTGLASIDCGQQSLGGRLLEGLLDFLHLDVRMR
ncbi:MAG: efflux RND transporter periplasmic adaptor subunit [Spartobacteria bacterium]